MLGCRPMTDIEVGLLMGRLEGRKATRTSALLVLGLRTGYRISELLALRICDLISNGQVVKEVKVSAKDMKGGKESRGILLHEEARPFIVAHWFDLIERGYGDESDYFFQRFRPGNKPIGRVQAWRDLTDLYKSTLVNWRGIGTHGLRKTFARRVLGYLRENWEPGQPTPFETLQQCLGHASIHSTMSYVAFANEKVNAAILNS